MHRLIATTLVAGALVLASAPPAGAVDEQFTLTADYVGLYPNADVTVPVQVHNPFDHPIAVHTASVQVGDAGPACPRTNLVAASFVGDVVVPAGADGTIPVHMHMPARAPDTCQGASFPLVFTASGADASPAGGNPGGSAPGGFAFTGAETGTVAAFGVACCVTGWVLTRRRRTVEEPA
jgi:hypothetical protein